MDLKKNRASNLERLRLPLFFLGLTFATAVTLSAFEWRTFEEYTILSEGELPLRLADEVIFTAVAEKPAKPKPPAPRPVVDTYIITKIETKLDIGLDVPDLAKDGEPTVIEIPALVETIAEDPIFDFPQVYPEFPGGEPALFAYLGSGIRYPAQARDAGVQGTVWVEFLVDKDGSITDVQILRGSGYGMDEEALKAISRMPAWTPGRSGGRPVKVRFRLPVKFSLQ